jgi:hypothetical protein
MIQETIFLVVISIVLILACIAFIIQIKSCIDQTRRPGGRYFGFNCDGCDRKTDRNGHFLLRCHIKPPIVEFLIRAKVLKDRRN